MDRQIVYPGSIPLDTDILNVQRNTLIALGYLTQATLGTASIVEGLACNPSQPASLSVVVGPGCITQFGDIDATSFGSLPALPTTPLVRMGVNVNSTNFTLTAPTAEGQAIIYLVEACLLEQDSNAVVLPYYNAANPGQPYSGPNNAGTAQMTSRTQTVQLQLKAGAPAAIGSGATPATDAGWVGLYSITVEFGQSAIVATAITVLPSAPFLPWKLPQLTPGTRNLAVFGPTTQGNWTVPAGVNTVKLRLWGGGGAGGNGFAGAGGGGAGGGYSEGFYAVGAGESFVVTVGNGGAGAGSAGGTSSFGNLASATGGQGGGNGGSGVGGSGASSGGVGFGTGLTVMGTPGGSAFGASGSWLSGGGGGAFGGTGGLAVTGLASDAITGANGVVLGAGGSGGVGSGLGGQGAPGAVLVEW